MRPTIVIVAEANSSASEGDTNEDELAVLLKDSSALNVKVEPRDRQGRKQQLKWAKTVHSAAELAALPPPTRELALQRVAQLCQGVDRALGAGAGPFRAVCAVRGSLGHALNYAAIAARYAVLRHDLDRVAVMSDQYDACRALLDGDDNFLVLRAAPASAGRLAEWQPELVVFVSEIQESGVDTLMSGELAPWRLAVLLGRQQAAELLRGSGADELIGVERRSDQREPIEESPSLKATVSPSAPRTIVVDDEAEEESSYLPKLQVQKEHATIHAAIKLRHDDDADEEEEEEEGEGAADDVENDGDDEEDKKMLRRGRQTASGSSSSPSAAPNSTTRKRARQDDEANKQGLDDEEKDGKDGKIVDNTDRNGEKGAVATTRKRDAGDRDGLARNHDEKRARSGPEEDEDVDEDIDEEEDGEVDILADGEEDSQEGSAREGPDLVLDFDLSEKSFTEVERPRAAHPIVPTGAVAAAAAARAPAATAPAAASAAAPAFAAPAAVVLDTDDLDMEEINALIGEELGHAQ